MAYKTNPALKKLEPEAEALVPEAEYGAEYEVPSGGGKRTFWTIVVVIVVLLVLWYFIPNYTSFKSLPALGSIWPSTKWQAVFLTNGQVYFGKIDRVGWSTVILKDIYYLQVVNVPLQRTIEGQATATANQETTQQLTLVKLGNELHGPTDEIRINRDQLMFTEFLKNDGRVVEAINNYLAGLKK